MRELNKFEIGEYTKEGSFKINNRKSVDLRFDT